MANSRINRPWPGLSLWDGGWNWKELVGVGLAKMLQEYKGPSSDHTDATPERVIHAFEEYFAGCKAKPEDALHTTFPNKGFDEMITLTQIGFVSFCAHHLVPFFGKVHFGYIPRAKIVGLSKIPRLVEVYAKRPQVQETMTVQIADAFQGIINPKGCAVVTDAQHMCMCVRGVKKEGVITRTSALRGVFKTQASTRSEFLGGIPKKDGGSWL